MENVLAKFQNELVILRRSCREFAEQYPRLAGKLHMSGEVCEDPFIEHLIQSSAFIAARISKRLDDDYPQFTEGLLDVLYPHYRRPFPSSSIVRLDCSGAKNGEATTSTTIPRGAELESAAVHGVRCKFRTVYDLTLAPIALSSATFDPLIKAPGDVQLPRNVTSCLHIRVETKNDKVALAPLALEPLRVFIDGEPSFCAALRDTLFMRCPRAYAEVGNGRWIPLPALPIAPVGFAEEDAIIPFGARSHPAYRLLTEYFGFPEKFNFVDIDLAAILAHLPAGCSRFNLHLAVSGLRADSSIARTLRTLSPDNLLLACSPVVNLFQKPGVPVAVTQFASDYSVLADAHHPRAFEVYSIDSVHMLLQRENESVATEFRPLYSLRHGEGENSKGRYWVLRHDEEVALLSPGHEKKITLVDVDSDPMAIEASSLSIALTCTNRDLPTMLGIGQAGGDFMSTPVANGNPIRFLRRPTPSYRFESGHGFHWRLISQLSLNHHALSEDGLQSFREMLTLNDLQQSPVSQRQIAGIVSLVRAETSAWRRGPRGVSLVHGIEVRLTLDEDAFVGSGMHLFVEIIDQFLALYVQLSSFVELVVYSHKTGEELIRCQPRKGSLSSA